MGKVPRKLVAHSTIAHSLRKTAHRPTHCAEKSGCCLPTWEACGVLAMYWRSLFAARAELWCYSVQSSLPKFPLPAYSRWQIEPQCQAFCKMHACKFKVHAWKRLQGLVLMHSIRFLAAYPPKCETKRCILLGDCLKYLTW